MATKRIAMPRLNYYSLLGVSPQAEGREIRAAFKRLMLKAHPDKNPGRKTWSERRVRELIEAFEVLSDPDRRGQFDLFYRRMGWGKTGAREPGGRGAQGADAEPYFSQRQDPRSRARLVLHHLLHRRPRAAVSILKEMESAIGPKYLSVHLEREDYLDCLFLLAEFFAARRQYVKAAERLKEFCALENTALPRRHYHDQVVLLLKDLYLRKIPRVLDATRALEALEAASELGLTPSEEMLRLRRTAEILVTLGRVAEARRVLERAQKLFPLSKDTERIRKTMEAAS